MKHMVFAAFALLPAPALAHAILVGGTPQAGQTVAAGPLHVDLEYNSRVDAARSRVTLTLAGGGPPTVLTLDPEPAAGHLTGMAEVMPGKYSLRWQVLAVDGHITRGLVLFMVAP